MGNGTQTVTLTEFLLARIAEDEECARWGRLFDDPSDPDSATKILRWDHARLRAECEAKRQIIHEHATFKVVADSSHAEDVPVPQALTSVGILPQTLTSAGIVTGLDRALKHLAAIYADHPDYQEVWRS